MQYYYIGQKKAQGKQNAKLRIEVVEGKATLQMYLNQKWTNLEGQGDFQLAPASKDFLGGIKVGNNLTVDEQGNLSAAYNEASTDNSGLMSAQDKQKLDRVISDLNRIQISRSSYLEVGDWAIVDQDCTINLPKCTKGAVVAISTTGSASNVKIVPYEGDIIIDENIASQYNIYLAGKYVYLELFGTSKGWKVARADNGDILFDTPGGEDDIQWLPLGSSLDNQDAPDWNQI